MILRCFVFLILFAAVAARGDTGSTASQSVSLAWDPSPSAAVTGYYFYTGLSGTTNFTKVDVGTSTSYTVTNLQARVAYCFYVTAHDRLGVESAPSSVITYTLLQPLIVSLPAVNVALDKTNITERDATGCTFTFTRTGDTTAALPVPISIGGTALNGIDYNYISNVVVIPAGAAAAFIVVVPVDDVRVNPTKTLVLSVASSAAYQVGANGSATLSILDTDVSSDGTGMSDREKLLAGLNPKDPRSNLKILSVRPSSPGQMQVTWSSVPAVTYRVLTKNSPADTNWNFASPPITASRSATSWLHSTTNGACFYAMAVVPSPSPALLSAARSLAGGVSLSWSAIPGLAYCLLAKYSPGATNWTTVSPPITATNSVMNWTDAAGNSASSYMVSINPASTPKILSVKPDPPADVFVKWSSAPGVAYQVLAKTSLNDKNWTAVSPAIIASGPVTSWFHPTNNNSGYYRIAILSQLNPTIQSVKPSGSGQVTVAWSSFPGVTYQLLAKFSASDPNWTLMAPPVTATNSVASATCATTSSSAFFRIFVMTR